MDRFPMDRLMKARLAPGLVISLPPFYTGDCVDGAACWKMPSLCTALQLHILLKP